MSPGWQSDRSLGTGSKAVNLNALPETQGIVTAPAAWLLPLRCLACGEAGADGLELCAACRAELPWNDSACARCALPLPRPEAACGACLRRTPAFAASFAPLRYAAPVDRLLPRLKFHAGLAEGRLLAALTLARVPEAWREGSDLLVPMPLHRRRLGRRGFNQALELARPLARAWNLALAGEALRRVRDTPAQSELEAEARRRNVRGAFEADATCVSERHVLLFDDVVTTGATVGEAAATLLRAGAREVRVLAVARVPGRT